MFSTTLAGGINTDLSMAGNGLVSFSAKFSKIFIFFDSSVFGTIDVDGDEVFALLLVFVRSTSVVVKLH